MAGLSSVSGAGHATDFSWAPSARTAMRLDDNVRGASRDAEAAVGFDIGGGVGLKAQNDTFASELIPKFNLRRFVVGSNLDADEYSVALNNDWLRERYTAGLDVSYIRDSTLSSEATDTGGTRNDVTDRDAISVQPSASYFLTDKLALQTSFLFNDVSYVNAGNTGFFDYRYLQGSAGANFAWRNDLTFFANFFVSDFDVKSLKSRTRNYGGQTGATWKWDESLEVSGALGWIAADISFVDQRVVIIADPFLRFALQEFPVEAATDGPIASVTIRKSWDSLQSRFDYTRQVSPSGRGSQSTSDRMALVIEKKLSDLLSLQFDGVYEMRSAEGQSAGLDIRGRDLNRNYSEVRGMIRYRLSQEWSISANYRHGRSQSTNLNSSSTANMNALYLAIEFNGLPNTFWNGL
jgi:hypothetical protein